MPAKAAIQVTPAPVTKAHLRGYWIARAFAPQKGFGGAEAGLEASARRRVKSGDDKGTGKAP
jgi:hypothetical protein